VRLAIWENVVFGAAEPIVVHAEKSARPLGLDFTDEGVVVNGVVIVGVVLLLLEHQVWAALLILDRYQGRDFAFFAEKKFARPGAVWVGLFGVMAVSFLDID
jgi:hypothetical protein